MVKVVKAIIVKQITDISSCFEIEEETGAECLKLKVIIY